MKNPIIRTIYLYLFALVGLGMLVIGSSMIINLGLKSWLFTNADRVGDYLVQPTPIVMDSNLEQVKNIATCQDECQLTEIQKEKIAAWLNDYEIWQEKTAKRDPAFYQKQSRERQASTAISLILVGLPLWLFHWATIKKDLKKSN